MRAAAVICVAAAGMWGGVVLRPAMSADDPSSAITLAASWGAELVCGYLLAATLLVAASRVLRTRGPLRLRFAPTTLVRLVDAAIGTSVAVAVVAGSAPAWATGPGGGAARSGAPTAASVSVPVADWPALSVAADPASPRAVQPSPAALQARSRARGRPAPTRGVAALVVRDGDSLWTLTRRWLGADATRAEVAVQWPRLYAANRAVIGPDPDLIHPGQRLVPPPRDERTTP
jgi:hypothetical protein